MTQVCTIKQRFLSKVQKTDTCWIWTGTMGSGGYGQFWFNGKTHWAHRVSYALFISPDLKNLCVCHSCDVRNCVNPAHLWLGTNADNTDDMVRKGRTVSGDKHWTRIRPESILRGEKQGSSKLTEEQVLVIREKYATDNYSQRELAKEFKVCQTMIGTILRRERWKHI